MYAGVPVPDLLGCNASVGDDAEAMRTLGVMRRLVREGMNNPDVVSVARHIVDGVPGRDDAALALAIREWMETHFRFVPDPLTVEYVRPPEDMLGEVVDRYHVQGDCDEAAILGAALATAVGLPVDFVAVGFDCPNAPYSHVYANVRTRAGDVDLDTTRSVPDLSSRISREVTVAV